jgi:hypothetical protein
VCQDGVANLHVGRAFADGENPTGTLDAHGRRRLKPDIPLARPNQTIPSTHPCRIEGHNNLAGARIRWVGKIQTRHIATEPPHTASTHSFHHVSDRCGMRTLAARGRSKIAHHRRRTPFSSQLPAPLLAKTGVARPDDQGQTSWSGDVKDGCEHPFGTYTILEGSSEIQRLVIARAGSGLHIQ